MAFTPERLQQVLAQYRPATRYWVGFSGGADSTALLHAMVRIRDASSIELCAIHFNHGLQEQAETWADQCEHYCREWDVPIEQRSLDIARETQRSLEEAARDARYACIDTLLQQDEIYLTAHHRDDQAETLLLNLLRGSGLEGMAAIPDRRRLGKGQVIRPLLEFSRDDLLHYLDNEGIAWLDDPSNQDIAYDRNFLRQDIVPRLQQRWPAVSERLAVSAGHARQSAMVLARLIDREWTDVIGNPQRLHLPGLLEQSQDEQSLVLRRWLKKHHRPGIPENQLKELVAQLNHADTAQVQWAGWVLRRYEDHLWLQQGELRPLAKNTRMDSAGLAELGPIHGTYHLLSANNSLDAELRIRSRRHGDRLKPDHNRPSRDLKSLFKQSGTPHFLRESVPLLTRGDELVAMGDWLTDHQFKDWLQLNNAQLQWRPADPVLKQLRAHAHEKLAGTTG